MNCETDELKSGKAIWFMFWRFKQQDLLQQMIKNNGHKCKNSDLHVIGVLELKYINLSVCEAMSGVLFYYIYFLHFCAGLHYHSINYQSMCCF